MYVSACSIVGGFNLEVCLRMHAHGAFCRSLLADYDMAAVAADPYLVAFAREDNSLLYVGEQTAVALFVVTFDSGHGAEFTGDFGKPSSSASCAMRSYMSVHS